jgi:hypothetical protein
VRERDSTNKDIMVGASANTHRQRLTRTGSVAPGIHTHTHGLRQGKHYDISCASPTDKNQITAVNSKLRSVSLVGRYIIGEHADLDNNYITLSLHNVAPTANQ